MSVVGTRLHDCPAIQRELNDYFLPANCDPSMRADVSPIVQFLYSQTNTRNVQQAVVDNGMGKIKQVQMRYDQIIPESEVIEVDECTRDCTATTKRGDLVTTYTIDPCIKQKVEALYDATDFWYNCQSAPERITKIFAQLISALRRKTQSKLVSQLSGLNGNWNDTVHQTFPGSSGSIYVNDSEQLVVKTKKDASEDPMAATVANVDTAIMQQEFCSGPAIFTGASYWQYAKLMNVGCCADNGLNLASIQAAYGKSIVWDRRLQYYMGVEGGIMMQPGAIQVIEFNEYQSEQSRVVAGNTQFARNYDTLFLVDPLTGIGMNFIISDNCGQVSIIGHTVTKLVTMPFDMFPVNDYMDGVNYITEFKVVNV